MASPSRAMPRARQRSGSASIQTRQARRLAMFGMSGANSLQDQQLRKRGRSPIRRIDPRASRSGGSDRDALRPGDRRGSSVVEVRPSSSPGPSRRTCRRDGSGVRRDPRQSRRQRRSCRRSSCRRLPDHRRRGGDHRPGGAAARRHAPRRTPRGSGSVDPALA